VDFPRRVPPSHARLSRNSTLPVVTGVLPESTVAVNVSYDPTVIAAFDALRLVVVGVCAPTERHNEIPTRSTNAECCISAKIEEINRTNLRQMEAVSTP